MTEKRRKADSMPGKVKDALWIASICVSLIILLGGLLLEGYIVPRVNAKTEAKIERETYSSEEGAVLEEKFKAQEAQLTRIENQVNTILDKMLESPNGGN